MLLLCRVAALLILSAILQACSHTPQVSIFPEEGQDYWSRRVQETWLPKTQMAVEQFSAFTSESGLPVLTQAPRILLSSREPGANPANSLTSKSPYLESVLLQEDSLRVLQYKSMTLPLETLTDNLMDQLAAGRPTAAEPWIRAGSRYLFSGAVLTRMQMKDMVRVRRSGMEEWLRSPACQSVQDLLVHANSSSGSLESGYAAGWILTQLQNQAGAGFMQGWGIYFRQAAAPEFDHEKAFQRAFGFSAATFQLTLDTRLQQLRSEQRTHAQTRPVATSYAVSTDSTRLPLQSKSALAGYTRYLEMRVPKAFVLSPRGGWAYVDDDINAIELAMTMCRQHDPVSCQIYAVDNEVVYTKNTNSIEVVMVSDGDDGWTQSIKTNWIPFVQSTANSFNGEILAQMGEALDASARIYVASTREDYAKALHDDLQTLAIETTHYRDHSSGVANGEGQIAVLLSSDMPREQMPELVAEIVMHELAHEWQGQLSHRYASFKPPIWITEGSAELLSAQLGAKLPGEVAKSFSPDDRRTRLIHWYKLGASPSIDKVVTANAKEWAKMGAKGEFHYQMAELMTHFLVAELGDRFPAVLRTYFQSAGRFDQTADKAFTNSFGMTSDIFITRFKTWLKTI